jgi:pyridoxamine 5'-phosphate oxidase-like protein
MTAREPVETKNLTRYGDPALPWSRADAALAAPPDEDLTWFLGTVRPDGTPHAAGVGALYLDGDVWFTSSPAARKARNLAADARCTFSVRVKGLDVVLEGTAERVTDASTLETLAARYREGGWPVQVDGDAFTAPYSAPSAGPPPWHVYRFRFGTVFGVATAEPYGASRWRFA